ncbi:MAG TPA: AsmA family protein [Candidatus Angelobacter sp.]
MKRFLKITGIVVAVIIVLILLIPLFINVDSFRPEVESKVSAALGRQVHIGKISASIFSGGAEADNITISDDPAFSKDPFLQASSLKIGLKLMPLIFSRQLQVTSITINSPDIHLLSNSAGKWNYSSLGNTGQGAKSSPATPASSSSSAGSDFSVEKLEIQNGKIRVAQTNGRSVGKEHAYEKVNLTATNISTHSAIPFTLTGVTPGGGSLDLQGQAGPLAAQEADKTPLEAKLTLQHADLAATGLFDPALAGVVDFDGTVKSDGRHLVSDGKAKANGLRLVKGGSPARRPISVDYKSDYGLDSDSGTVNANVHTGNSTANANGTLNARGQTTIAHVKVSGNNMAVNDVEGLLPAFGISLPSGASLQGGSINMDFDAQGPLDALVINGPVNITGVHLTGFNLTGKLGAIAAFTGIQASNDTLIQKFSSLLHVAPAGIKADNILLDMPSIGQITGNGLINENQTLDFKMLLKLVGGGGMLGQLTNISGNVQNKGIPFTIEGTTANPTFRPTAAGVVGLFGNAIPGLSQNQQGQQGQNPVGGLLNGILNKKKKPPQ